VQNAEQGAWAQLAISLWRLDTDLQREFPCVSDFYDWMLAVTERLVRSAEKK
jgi:hypothetical protein